MSDLPRICVYGAGAVGGFAAARLMRHGQPVVSVVARGVQLLAIRKHGLRLLEPGTQDGSNAAWRPVVATDRPAELPPQDLVIVTLKAPSLPAAAADIAALLGTRGVALFVTNGVPWWW